MEATKHELGSAGTPKNLLAAAAEPQHGTHGLCLIRHDLGTRLHAASAARAQHVLSVVPRPIPLAPVKAQLVEELRKGTKCI